jgi:galactonate dehydratase
MEIADFKLYLVPPRWLFLKIETDTGLSGWGEPVVESKAATVKTAVTEMMEMLLGKDPLNIEDHWNRMYRTGSYRGGPVLMSAIAGIDQALWDIKGKYFGAPIHQLQGGRVRDAMRMYSWINGRTPEELGAVARRVAVQGFAAVKMNAVEAPLQYVDTPDKIAEAVRRVEAVREAVGPAVSIGVDFHGRVHKPMAKILAKELERFHLLFIEEAVLPENIEALRDIAPLVATPLATGERMFTRWHFKPLLIAGHVDLIQPDLSHAGGISECKKILSMAEAFDVAAAPHCPLGPIALAASLQVDASCHNAVLQEQVAWINGERDEHFFSLLKNPEVFDLTEGRMAIPSGAGLGVEIDEARVEELSRGGHAWRAPHWRHEDGSIAEW